MKKIIKIESCSDKAIHEFEIIKKEIQPIKKITVFFENANFILTKYTPDNDVVFIAEGYNGTEIHVAGFNCGYRGGGPGSTYRVLKGLNFSDDIANLAFNSRGFSLEIDGESVKIKKDTDFFQWSEDFIHKENVFNFNDFSQIDTNQRRITMYNPQINGFNSLLNIIDIMNPISFEFFIGKNSPMDDGYRFTSTDLKQTFRRSNGYDGIKHVNIIIRSAKFDIYCLVDTNVISTIVNVLHLYLFKKSFFEEKSVGYFVGYRCVQVDKKSMFANFLEIFSKKRYIHETIRINKGEQNEYSRYSN